MTTALIIVDPEKEWASQESDYYVGEPTSYVERTNELIGHARGQGWRVVFTRHVEEGGTAFKEAAGAEFLDGLDVQESDPVIVKHRISPFYRTNLDETLEGVERIVIGGILTNLCVRSLAEGAYDRDYEITIVSDCCLAFDDETHAFTLRDLKVTREGIEIMDLAELLGA